MKQNKQKKGTGDVAQEATNKTWCQSGRDRVLDWKEEMGSAQ